MATSEAILPRAQASMRRLDMRLVVGILLMLVAIVGGSAMVRAGRARVAVVIATAAVQPGEIIGADDLGVAEVAVTSGVTTLAASERESLVGRIAAEPLWAGKIVSEQSASSAPPLGRGEVAMSVALGAERAAGGTLRSGDRVAVLAATKNASSPTASVVFTDVAVLAVTDPSESADGNGDMVVTLRLRLEQARGLAAAIAAGEIDIVQLADGRA